MAVTTCVCLQSAVPNKAIDLRYSVSGRVVNDTDDAFRPVEVFGAVSVANVGRWTEVGGECIDYVIDGCFNNGTCVAPNTVWELVVAAAVIAGGGVAD